MAYLNTAAAYAAILAAKDTGNPADKVTWAELSNILRSISDDIDSLRTIEANYVSTALSYSNPTWLTGLAWSKISGTPTSLSGYGITDPVVLTSGSYANPSWITSLAYSKLTGAPVLGTVAAINTNGNGNTYLAGDGTWKGVSFSTILDKPSTLAGYGIGDAFPLSGGTLSGTAGNGFVGYTAQSATPTTPSSGFRLFANNANALSWVGANGFVRTFDGTANTADRVYTLPDTSGTFGLLGTTQTWSGVNTFSSTVNVRNASTPKASFLTGVNNSGTPTIAFGNITETAFIKATPTGALSYAHLDFESNSVRFLRMNANSLENELRATQIFTAQVSPTANNSNASLFFANSNASAINGTGSGAAIYAIASGAFGAISRLDIAIKSGNNPIVSTSDTALSIFADKNVAVGTTVNGGFKLDVNGTLRATGLATLTGGVVVGGSSLNASAVGQFDSTTKGVLVPRMTSTQRTAIASPATGLIVYDTDLAHICYYDGSSWRKISHSAA